MVYSSYVIEDDNSWNKTAYSPALIVGGGRGELIPYVLFTLRGDFEE